MECAQPNLEKTAGRLSELQSNALLSIFFQELIGQLNFLKPEINFHPSVAEEESSKTGFLKALILPDKKTASTGCL